MEFRFDAMLCSKLSNEKCRGRPHSNDHVGSPQVPQP